MFQLSSFPVVSVERVFELGVSGGGFDWLYPFDSHFAASEAFVYFVDLGPPQFVLVELVGTQNGYEFAHF